MSSAVGLWSVSKSGFKGSHEALERHQGRKVALGLIAQLKKAVGAKDEEQAAQIQFQVDLMKDLVGHGWYMSNVQEPARELWDRLIRYQ